jgi:hypothetical protein
MSVTLQHRRGTESQNNSFTGAQGEIVVDTTNEEIRLHNGVKLGGKILGGMSSEDTIASFRLMTKTPDTVYVTGYHTANDGAFGSHFFKKVTDTGQVDNGGTIIRTINGVYVLQYDGAINVMWFGADNTGTLADNSVAFNNAVTSMNGEGILIFPAGNYNLTASFIMPLSGINQSITLMGYGANLHLTGKIVGIDRERPTSTTSGWTTQIINIEGFTIWGDLTPWQYGVRMFTTYSLSMKHIKVNNCDYGIAQYFCLNSKTESCMTTNNVTVGFGLLNGNSDIEGSPALTGSTWNNANSNGSTFYNCRDFARVGARASFLSEACDTYLFQSCISEGGNPINAFEHHNHGSTVSVGGRYVDPHIENNPTNAVFALYETSGGQYIIDGQDNIANSPMLDLGAVSPSAHFKILSPRWISNFQISGTNITTRNPLFTFETAANVSLNHFADVANWTNGVIGQYYAKGFNASNQIIEENKFETIVNSFQNYTINSGLDGQLRKIILNSKWHVDLNPGLTSYGVKVNGRLHAFGAVTSGATLGTVVGKYPIYNEAGTLIGYAPLYNSIT